MKPVNATVRSLLIAGVLVISAPRLPAPIPESPSPTPAFPPTANVAGLSVSVVENFVKSLSANSADVQLQFYADEVSYYEMGRVTKHAIREDLEHDIRLWPSRVYSIHDSPKITKLSPDVFQAEFPMSYTLTNSKRLSSGILEMTIRFHSDAQTWRVFEIRRKPVLAQKKEVASERRPIAG